MSSKSVSSLVPFESIEQRIRILRGQKILLDEDLASLYGVTTKTINQALKRNIRRFPPDFLFQLTEDEMGAIRSQNVTG